MRTLALISFAFALLALAPLPSFAAGGGGGGGAGGDIFRSPVSRRASPEERAERKYKQGLKKRDYAWKHERKAAETDKEKKHRKELEKARKDFHSAIKYYREAIELDPTHHGAHSSLGYALRRVGEFDAAIEAYDTALGLAPAYAEAIEYRAEAHLALNQLDRVQDAYVRLFALDRERADELMAAIDVWLERAEATPPDVPANTIGWFRSWVAERKELAAQTVSQRTPDETW